MPISLEELRVLRDAEAVADEIWQQVVQWEVIPWQLGLN